MSPPSSGRARPYPNRLCLGRLRAVVSLNDHEIRARRNLPQLQCRLVFGRPPAVECRLIRGKLEDDIAAAARALGILELAAADHETGPVFLERGGVRRDVELISLRIADIDPGYPVALGHSNLLFARGGPDRRRTPSRPLASLFRVRSDPDRTRDSLLQ